MLCLVFAVAGPVMPGAGDVSPMDPTMAYGAAPNMLVFAPDRGSRDEACVVCCSAACGRAGRGACRVARKEREIETAARAPRPVSGLVV